MKIHELPGDSGSREKVKRVGRGKGSGHGGRSTRGNKGGKSRTGGGKSDTSAYIGGQMPLSRQLPKRGFNNADRIVYQVVNLTQLNDFDDGATIDAAMLRSRGLIGSAKKPVKLLAKGDLSRKLTVKVDRISSTAAAAVEAKGGTVEATVGRRRERKAPRRGTKRPKGAAVVEAAAAPEAPKKKKKDE